MTQKHILPYPRFLVFLASSLPPKFFPPTYLHPPTYLTSFYIHSIMKIQERLKWKGKTSSSQWEGKSGSQNNALEVGARSDKPEWELQGKLRPFFFVIYLLGVVVTKKAMATFYRCLFLYVMCRHFLLQFYCNEEGDDSCYHLFFFFERKKTTTVCHRLFFWFCYNKKVTSYYRLLCYV